MDDWRVIDGPGRRKFNVRLRQFVEMLGEVRIEAATVDEARRLALESPNVSWEDGDYAADAAAVWRVLDEAGEDVFLDSLAGFPPHHPKMDDTSRAKLRDALARLREAEEEYVVCYDENRDIGGSREREREADEAVARLAAEAGFAWRYFDAGEGATEARAYLHDTAWLLEFDSRLWEEMTQPARDFLSRVERWRRSSPGTWRP